MVAVPRLKPLARSVLSFAFPRLGTVHGYDNPLGTISATSCYSIFLRHMSLLGSVGIKEVPKIVAELGPGSSFGTGFAALLAGAEKYCALDVIDFSNAEVNFAVFDEIVTLYRRKAPIPSSGVHSRRFPELDHYDFPHFIGFEPDSAFEKRAAAIRKDIALKGGTFVQVAAPWTELSVLTPGSVDWIFSQSVLEHVDDLADAYVSMSRWLRPGGYMSHLIDFSSHDLFQDWNGHWAVSERMWHVIRGKRPYLINRQPYAYHQKLAADCGFTTIAERRAKRFDGLIPTEFSSKFRSITDEDARTIMVFAVSRLIGAR